MLCPHCQKEFDPKRTSDKKHLTWKTFQWAGILVLIAMVLYQFNTSEQATKLLSSVTTLNTNIKNVYEVFDQASSNIQGRIVKQVRIKLNVYNKEFVVQQAKELISAERNNNPTNIIYLYFYVTDKDPEKLPLDSWNAKVTFINFSIIRDLSPGDFAEMENIAPGTYLEIRN